MDRAVVVVSFVSFAVGLCLVLYALWHAFRGDVGNGSEDHRENGNGGENSAWWRKADSDEPINGARK